MYIDNRTEEEKRRDFWVGIFIIGFVVGIFLLPAILIAGIPLMG